MIPSLFLDIISDKMVDIAQKTIWDLELWRIFTAFLTSTSDFFSPISLGFAFIWIKKHINVIDNRFRTKKLQLFIKSFRCSSSISKFKSFSIVLVSSSLYFGTLLSTKFSMLTDGSP